MVAMSLALLAIVWHWRRDMAAWLSAMVSEGNLALQAEARCRAHLVDPSARLLCNHGVAEIYGELSNDTAATGIDTIETALMGCCCSRP